MLAAVGLAALAASAPALALAQQQIVLTQDGGCTLGGVGSVAHVTAHYTASDGGKTAGLSFNLRFDPTEFAVVGKAEAGLPECAEHSLIAGDGFVSYSCASMAGQKVLRPRVDAVAKIALKVLAPGVLWAGTVRAEANPLITTTGYTFAPVAPLDVKLCAAGQTPSPITAAPTTAQPTPAASSMLSAIRGGNDPQEDAKDAKDEDSSDWERLAREERTLVKQLAERQTALEKQQQALIAHQTSLTSMEQRHNSDMLARVGDLKNQHTTLVHQVQRKTAEVHALEAKTDALQVTHKEVLRKMQVPEAVIAKLYADPKAFLATTTTTAAPKENRTPEEQKAWDEREALGTTLGTPVANKCGPVPVPGNGYKLAYNTNHVGGTVKFACQLGYFLIGSEERECLGNFRWSGSATFCEPFTKAPTPAPTPSATDSPTPAPTELKLCPNFRVPEHSQISLTTRRPGGKVHFNCNPPFLLIGPDTAHCMASGHWTVFPACIGKITTCSHLKCKLRVRQISAFETQSAVAVFYDHKEKNGERHHCQFKHNSKDVHDCKCWCWFDSKLASKENNDARRATLEF